MEEHLAALGSYAAEIRPLVAAGDGPGVEKTTKTSLASVTKIGEIIGKLAKHDEDGGSNRRSSLHGDTSAISTLTTSVANTKQAALEAIVAAKAFVKDAGDATKGQELLKKADALELVVLALHRDVARASAPPEIPSLVEEGSEVEVPAEFASCEAASAKVLSANSRMARAVREGDEDAAAGLMDEMAGATREFLVAGKALFVACNTPGSTTAGRCRDGLQETQKAAMDVVNAAEALGAVLEDGDAEEVEAATKDMTLATATLELAVYSFIGIWKPFGIRKFSVEVMKARLGEVQDLMDEIDAMGERIDPDAEPERIETLSRINEEVEDAVQLVGRNHKVYKEDPSEANEQKLVDAINGVVRHTKGALTAVLRDTILADIATARNKAAFHASEGEGDARKANEACSDVCVAIMDLAKAITDDVEGFGAAVDRMQTAAKSLAAALSAYDLPVVKLTLTHVGETVDQVLAAAQRAFKNPSDTMADQLLNHHLKDVARSMGVLVAEVSGARSRNALEEKAREQMREREEAAAQRREQAAKERLMVAAAAKIGPPPPLVIGPPPPLGSSKEEDAAAAEPVPLPTGKGAEARARLMPTYINAMAAMAEVEGELAGLVATIEGGVARMLGTLNGVTSDGVAEVAAAAAEMKGVLAGLPKAARPPLVLPHGPASQSWVTSTLHELTEAVVALHVGNVASAGDVEKLMLTESLGALRKLAVGDVGRWFVPVEGAVFRLLSAASLVSDIADAVGDDEGQRLRKAAAVCVSASELVGSTAFVPQHLPDAVRDAIACCDAFAKLGHGRQAEEARSLLAALDWMMQTCHAASSRKGSQRDGAGIPAAAAALAEALLAYGQCSPPETPGQADKVQILADKLGDVRRAVSFLATAASATVFTSAVFTSAAMRLERAAERYADAIKSVEIPKIDEHVAALEAAATSMPVSASMFAGARQDVDAQRELAAAVGHVTDAAAAAAAATTGPVLAEAFDGLAASLKGSGAAAVANLCTAASAMLAANGAAPDDVNALVEAATRAGEFLAESSSSASTYKPVALTAAASAMGTAAVNFRREDSAKARVAFHVKANELRMVVNHMTAIH